MNSENNIRILYIEDNPANYRLVHRLLSQAGYAVHWAEEGIAGLEMAKQIQPDLILMDINLPGLSGFELTSKFRGIPELKSIPIIAVTAKTQKSDRETALVVGCNGFIPKPIDPFSFVSQIRAYLGGRQESVDKGTEGRVLRQFNIKLLERLEQQLNEAQEANQKLIETQQILEASNNSLSGLISLSQDLVREHDPWQLLTRVLTSLIIETHFDTFVMYLQHQSGSYWEGLQLEEGELTQAPILLSDCPFIQKLNNIELESDWIHGPSLLAMPIWMEGNQLDIWLSNGHPCLLLNSGRQKTYIRGFWAFDRKNVRPFLPKDFEMVKLYGRLAQVCLENAEMISGMDEKTRALRASYEKLEKTHLDLQKAKTELKEKDRLTVLNDTFSKIANHLKEPVATLSHSCQVILQSVQTEDLQTKQALDSIGQFTGKVRGLFQTLMRRTQPETADLPEWIEIESLVRDEIEFMEVEGLLSSDNVQIDMDLSGARVYGVYSDFTRLLRIMVLNSLPTQESFKALRHFQVWRDGKSIHLKISDSAGQFHQSAIDLAFEPFQGHREALLGSRIPHPGLPSCPQILATYEGSIALENTEQGATLEVTIGIGG